MKSIGWHKDNIGWHKMGMTIQAETWSGKRVFLCYMDGNALHGGADFATEPTLMKAKQACDDVLTLELIVDSANAG